MNPSNNIFLEKDLIKPSGKIDKNKINFVTGAITQPFAEMIWLATSNDMLLINDFIRILITMNTPSDRHKLFKFIQLLYGFMGLDFLEEAVLMDVDDTVLEYFISSFTADFCEIMQDFMLESKI